MIKQAQSPNVFSVILENQVCTYRICTYAKINCIFWLVYKTQYSPDQSVLLPNDKLILFGQTLLEYSDITSYGVRFKDIIDIQYVTYLLYSRCLFECVLTQNLLPVDRDSRGVKNIYAEICFSRHHKYVH